MKKYRIIFMGTPEFAVEALKALHDEGHEIVAVYTQPPKPKGRGYEIQESPVHVYAQHQGLTVYTPHKLSQDDVIETFRRHEADVAIVAAYGLLLPKVILDLPPLGCINIHGSLLPRWRGAAPIQRALMAGDEQTGITIMQMDEGLDTGSILQTKCLQILDHHTQTDLYEILSKMGAELIVSTLQKIASNDLHPIPQPETGATYAHKLDKTEGLLDFNQPARVVYNRIRGLVPQVSVWITREGARFKIIKAHIALKTEDFESLPPPGTLFLSSDRLYLACLASALEILIIQPEGGKIMTAGDFIRGFKKHLF